MARGAGQEAGHKLSPVPEHHLNGADERTEQTACEEQAGALALAGDAEDEAGTLKEESTRVTAAQPAPVALRIASSHCNQILFIPAESVSPASPAAARAEL